MLCQEKSQSTATLFAGIFILLVLREVFGFIQRRKNGMDANGNPSGAVLGRLKEIRESQIEERVHAQELSRKVDRLLSIHPTNTSEMLSEVLNSQKEHRTQSDEYSRRLIKMVDLQEQVKELLRDFVASFRTHCGFVEKLGTKLEDRDE